MGKVTVNMKDKFLCIILIKGKVLFMYWTGLCVFLMQGI